MEKIINPEKQSFLNWLLGNLAVMYPGLLLMARRNKYSKDRRVRDYRKEREVNQEKNDKRHAEKIKRIFNNGEDL